MLTKQPERIERLMRECGLSVAVEDDARKKLENEINVLYDRLASSLKEENKRLTAVVKRLTDENSLLKSYFVVDLLTVEEEIVTVASPGTTQKRGP